MKNYWYYLTGSNAEFSLESRIFHSLCIVAIIALAYAIPTNFALGLQISAWISVILFSAQTILFYLSRFKRKTEVSRILSILIFHLFLLINYFYNSGINGPTLLLLLVVFFLVISVSNAKEYKIWISLNIIIVLSLIASEYYYPELIKKSYSNRETYFADIASSYMACILIILIGVRYIKKNYYLTQQLLEIKASDLERLNQTKNKLFSIVSHDLRAPIATVQGYLEAISHMDMSKENWEEVKGSLIQMTHSTDNMLSNLLIWSKSQMDGIKCYKKRINLADTLIPVIEVFQSIAHAKKITMDYSIDNKLIVNADQNMLQLVVRNFLSNSIKFTHPGGNISIKVISDELTYIIQISDTGIGMTEEIKKSIFNVTAESSYGTKNEKGIGLGLNLCKEFTEMQGGSIWFTSVLGQGSIFCISMSLN
jgi:two-component system sensor histidine kinase/response regulator